MGKHIFLDVLWCADPLRFKDPGSLEAKEQPYEERWLPSGYVKIAMENHHF